MPSPEPKLPGPDHPITIKPTGKHIRVVWKGHTIADTTAALDLQESTYPVVRYIPRADADMHLLQRSEHHTRCPYKGEASYYSLVADDGKSENAVWSYEDPYPAMHAIEGYLAFYPERVDRIEEVA